MRSLFLPQCGDRIDSRRTKGGGRGREDADCEQHRDRRQEHHRIGSVDLADEGRAHGERHRHSQGQPARHARQHELQRLADDRRQV